MAAGSARSLEVDGIRACAALAVVFQHLALFTSAFGVFPHAAALASQYGQLGVPVFFVLSGFCVGTMWFKAPDWRSFAWRRFVRIFPPYYASVLVVLVLRVATCAWLGVPRRQWLGTPTLSEAVAIATLTTWPCRQIGNVQVVYWTLTFEVAFYLVMSLVLVAPRQARLVTLVLTSAVCTALGLSPALDARPSFLFWCILWPLFALGVATSLFRRARWAALAVGMPAVIGLLNIVDHRSYDGYAPTALVTAGTLLLVARGLRIPPLRWLAALGRVSYSLYLVHLPVAGFLGQTILRGVTTPAGRMLAVVVTLAAQIVAARVFYACVESWCVGESRATAAASGRTDEYHDGPTAAGVNAGMRVPDNQNCESR